VNDQNDKSQSECLLTIEERYLSGIIWRFRKQPCQVFRRSVIWGCAFTALIGVVLVFRGEKEGTPAILPVLVTAFSLASLFSLVAEAAWRKLTIHPDGIQLKYGGRRVVHRDATAVREIIVLREDGSHMAVAIRWFGGGKASWVVAGTIIGKPCMDDLRRHYPVVP